MEKIYNENGKSSWIKESKSKEISNLIGKKNGNGIHDKKSAKSTVNSFIRMSKEMNMLILDHKFFDCRSLRRIMGQIIRRTIGFDQLFTYYYPSQDYKELGMTKVLYFRYLKKLEQANIIDIVELSDKEITDLYEDKGKYTRKTFWEKNGKVIKINTDIGTWDIGEVNWSYICKYCSPGIQEAAAEQDNSEDIEPLNGHSVEIKAEESVLIDEWELEESDAVLELDQMFK